MGLSNDLISEFVKVTNDSSKSNVENSVFGKVVEYNNTAYVKLDGSELLTPISTTTDVHAGERVMVTIKNHTAIITGNISSPSVNLETNIDNGDGTTVKLSDLGISIRNGILRVDKLEANSLTAESAIIKDLQTNKLSADSAIIKDLQANSLTAESAIIKSLQTDKLDAETANITYATIKSLDATNANVKAITAEKIFTESGVIKDLTMQDGYVTGELVGVTMKGDLIEAGTLIADRVIISGENGLYYELNTNGMTVTANQTEYNSLNGSVITAKSVTADKIKVTDLVAFGATIANFKIDENAIYSGVKSTISDDTTGLYLGSDGQIAFGDGINYLKYFKDTDDTFKLILGIGNENVSNIIGATVNGLFIGNQSGNNIVIDTNSFDICNGSDVLASYSSNKVELGRNNKKTVIDLCNGTAQISNEADNTDYNRLKIESDDSISLTTSGGMYFNTVDYNSYGDRTITHLMLQSDSPWIPETNTTEKVSLSAFTDRDGDNVHVHDVISMTSSSMSLGCDYTVTDKSYNRRATINIAGLENTSETDSSKWYSAIKIAADKTGISGDLYFNTNAAAIYGKKQDVGSVEILVPQDESGNLLIGRGTCTNGHTGKTKIYGYNIYLCPYDADPYGEAIEYKPYYAADDSIELRWFGSGYITSNNAQVCFSIPLAKPVIGGPTVNVNSIYGLCIRQSGYCYGATASDSYVVPSSYSAALDGDGTSVRIVANMPNTTNTTNNAPCGIDASIQIMFS